MTREQIENEAEWIFEKMRSMGAVGRDYERQYWQGRIDSLAWALRQVEKEGK